jgi:EpsI family protein
MMKNFRYILVYLLLGLTALFMYTHENIAVPVSKPLTDIPVQLDGWHMTGQSRFSPDVLANLKPSDYLYRTYKDQTGNKAAVYLGYHNGGPESGPIHSPKHCLPGSGWFELSQVMRTIQVDGKEVPLVEAIYQMGDQKELFLYFFQVKGKILTDEYSLKLAEIINSIFYKRRDSAFIRISVSFQGEAHEAAKAADRLLTNLYPHIAATLPL